MKIFRNIYFHGESMKGGNGSIDVYYTGHIYNNAKHIKDVLSKYDSSVDLYIVCNTCAAKKYGKFIKVKK